MIRNIKHLMIKKYKTFSVLIYRYINASGNWEIGNIAQKTLTEEWREIFLVDIELYQHGS